MYADPFALAAAFPAQGGRSSSIETGTKLYISNLDYGVSNEDIKVDSFLSCSLIDYAHINDIVSWWGNTMTFKSLCFSDVWIVYNWYTSRYRHEHMMDGTLWKICFAREMWGLISCNYSTFWSQIFRCFKFCYLHWDLTSIYTLYITKTLGVFNFSLYR